MIRPASLAPSRLHVGEEGVDHTREKTVVFRTCVPKGVELEAAHCKVQAGDLEHLFEPDTNQTMII